MIRILMKKHKNTETQRRRGKRVEERGVVVVGGVGGVKGMKK